MRRIERVDPGRIEVEGYVIAESFHGDEEG
jgi:hypothetical protein